MADELFIEKREDEGDYAIRRRGSERASDVCDTQREAIERAAEIDPNATILLERVRIQIEAPGINGANPSS